MSIGSNIAALLAASDLAVVKSITGAMRAADIASGKGVAATALGPAPDTQRPLSGTDRYETRRHITPTPVYERRMHITPTTFYERRPVIHPTEKFAPVQPAPLADATPAIKLLPPAPWHKPIWETPVAARPVIKKVVRMNDKPRSGQFIDLFI